MQQEEPNKYVKELTQEKYKYGFTTEVHTEVIEKGLKFEAECNWKREVSGEHSGYVVPI